MPKDKRVIECTSRDGITIGLVDAMLTLASVLHERLKAEQKRFKKLPDRRHSGR